MNPEFWIKRWQTGQIGFHQSEFDPLLKEFFPKLEPGRVLVPLCGKSRDLLWLAGQGHQVVGVELSPLASEAFFKENLPGLKVVTEKRGGFTVYRAGPYQIFCGDFFELQSEELGHFEAVYDRASMIALPPELRARYIDKLKDLSWNILFLITLEYPTGLKEGPPFSISIAEVENFYAGKFEVEHCQTQDVSAHFNRDAKVPNLVASEHAFRVKRLIS